MRNSYKKTISVRNYAIIIKYFILIVFICLALSTSGLADENLLQKVSAAYEKEDFDMLKDLAEEWMDDEPENAVPVYLLSYSYYILNYPDEARETLSRAASMDSEFEQLLEFAEQLNEAIPGNYYSKVMLGDAYARANRNDDALSVLEKAISRNPDKFIAYFVLGHTHMKLDDSENAEKNLKRTVEENPDFLKGYIYLGFFHARKENYDEAEKVYIKGILKNEELGNRTAVIHLYLANSMLSAEEYERALSIVYDALEISPDNPGISLLLGDVYRRKGELEKAEEIYRESYKYVPSRGDVYRETLDSRIESIERIREAEERKLDWR